MNRNWLKGSVAAAGFSFAIAAQACAGTLPVLAQMKVSESGGKNYVVEILVTVVLMGAALFAVCKTSRRS